MDKQLLDKDKWCVEEKNLWSIEVEIIPDDNGNYNTYLDGDLIGKVTPITTLSKKADLVYEVGNNLFRPHIFPNRKETTLIFTPEKDFSGNLDKEIKKIKEKKQIINTWFE